MKICFLSSMHPPYDKRVFEKEAVSLALEGHDVVHLCPDDAEGAHEKKGVTLVTYIKKAGIKARLFQLFSLYQRALNVDADAYHCNEVDSWIIGVLLKIRHGKKCIFDVHEHYPSTFSDGRLPSFLKPIMASLIKTLFKILLPYTDNLVFAKRTVAGDFPNSSEKQVLVQNFTSLSEITLPENRTCRNHSDKMTIVHLGLIGKIRGWPQILEAMSLSNADIHLHIIGTINDGSEADFWKQVEKYKLKKRIKISEWLPFHEAFAHLIKADVGLIAFQPNITNHIFALPHKMFDYMAAGMAIVIPKDAMEIAPIVQENECGLLIDSSNPQDMADKFKHLYSNPADALNMGMKGQHAVKSAYNWEIEVQKLFKMYQDLENSK